MKSLDVIQNLKKYSDPNRAKSSMRYFKTGVGEYGENDVFWGLTMSEVRVVAKQFKKLPLDEVKLLLHHECHEVRMCGVIILTTQYNSNPARIFNFYMSNLEGINNWDLVDCSASYIVGAYLFDKDRAVLYKLAQSKNLWKKRISIIATGYFIKNKDYKDTFEIAKLLLSDKHDLIHKAVGWMLREVGKNCGDSILKKFLDIYATSMPRTCLRYSIEKFSERERQYYLKLTSLSHN